MSTTACVQYPAQWHLDDIQNLRYVRSKLLASDITVGNAVFIYFALDKNK